MTLFAKIAILDLLLVIILPDKRYPDYVSNDCGGALSGEWCNQKGQVV